MTNAIAVHFPTGKRDFSLPTGENPLVAVLHSQKLLVWENGTVARIRKGNIVPVSKPFPLHVQLELFIEATHPDSRPEEQLPCPHAKPLLQGELSLIPYLQNFFHNFPHEPFYNTTRPLDFSLNLKEVVGHSIPLGRYPVFSRFSDPDFLEILLRYQPDNGFVFRVRQQVNATRTKFAILDWQDEKLLPNYTEDTLILWKCVRPDENKPNTYTGVQGAPYSLFKTYLFPDAQACAGPYGAVKSYFKHGLETLMAIAVYKDSLAYDFNGVFWVPKGFPVAIYNVAVQPDDPDEIQLSLKEGFDALPLLYR